MDGTECDILVDTGANKSYMSKSYFMRYKSLQSLPKFTSTTTRIQVGNGQYVGVLFVIPVIMTIQNHRFEIFTLVSEIHENVDLVIGIKNLFELEGLINSWDSCVNFLKRSIHFFPKEIVSVKPKVQRLIILEAPFVEETKIKQGVLQQNLNCMYHFESANKVCDHFNKLINTLKKEEEETCNTDRYPWLDDSDKRKHITRQVHRSKRLMPNQTGKAEVEKSHL